MNYCDKYLKYKNKYLQLKYYLNQKGGDQAFINNIDRINLFTDAIMEEYLNPIYGMILCNNGYINNNYFLAKSNLIDTPYSKIIKKYTKEIPGTIQPSKKYMEYTPLDIGRFIALKYYRTINPDLFEITQKDKIIFKLITGKEDIGLLQKYIALFGRDILKNDDLFAYHFVLYCLWWVSNDDEGISKYYEGINEVFSIINKYLPEDKPILLIITASDPTPYSFENLIFKIVNEPFKIYNQEQSNTFCDLTGKSRYPDCGETTVRNLINLICLKDNYFNLDILIGLGADPESKLIEYYTRFNNFEKQTKTNKINIYGLELNARDAWSKLIIEYANKNINFASKCDNNHHNYELNAKFALDKSMSNFSQIIKNLLPNFTKWDDIRINHITNIIDETVDGIGKIIIEHEIYNKIIIYCLTRHYYMAIGSPKNSKKFDKQFNIDLYRQKNPSKYNIILVLFKKEKDITIHNYLHIKYDTNLLANKFDMHMDNDLTIKLFNLSLTEQFDSDTRRRINIDVDNSEFFNYIIKISKDPIINEYTYLLTDFNFLKNIPTLTHLNIIIKNIELTSINLSGLSNITSIGNNFFQGCESLTSIDLTELSKVTTVGDGFFEECKSLTSIDLSGLSNVTFIGNNFLNKCENLINIDLSRLSNVTSVGSDFLSGCKNLTSINLLGLSNVTSIGDDFLHGCTNLRDIDLSPLSNVTSIKNGFLSNCIYLTSIDLSRLSNVTSIGDRFLDECNNLTSINLSGLSKLTSIGNNFLNKFDNLTSINLSGLSNVKSIGDYFLNGCKNLTSINLSGLYNVISINDRFLSSCRNLTSINLSGLSNVTSIGNNFLHGCEHLTSIDLSPLSNVTSIGNNFLSHCKLRDIDLSPLSNVTSVGGNFLDGCFILRDIDLSPLSNIKSIDNYFLNGCTNLRGINLSRLSNVTSIGGRFLFYCNNLISIDLSRLSSVISIGDYFLGECKNLTSIDLSALSNITSISDSFLENCENLTSIDLSELSNVTSIGNYFLNQCINLVSIDLSGLSNVTSIGNNFLSFCYLLTSINLSGLSNITSIGNNFLLNCESLTSIDLTELSKVTTVGDGFFEECKSLTSIDLSGLLNLKYIGKLIDNQDKIKYTQGQIDILRMKNPYIFS